VHNPFTTVVQIIYPLQCGGCGMNGYVICSECRDFFRMVDEGTACPRCGRWVGKPFVCGECLQDQKWFYRGYFGFYFEDRLREALHAFKFNGRKDVGRYLVFLLRKKILSFSDTFDCIIPIPVSNRRLKERGFNQSFIIGEEISRMTNKPIYTTVLYKIKETKDQYSLSREERKKNIRDAFAVCNKVSIEGKRILLVDDLFTTGATVHHASRILMDVNTQEVIVFALARTPS